MASSTFSSTSAAKLEDVPSPLSSRSSSPDLLDGIPHEFVIDTLRKLAVRYYNDVDSSDCTIIIPLDAARVHTVMQDPHIRLYAPKTETVMVGQSPSSLGRRATEPSLNAAPARLMMRLHADYLAAHSSMFRLLFSNAHPVDLMQIMPQAILDRCAQIPGYKQMVLPRVLPSSDGSVVCHVPLPDPASFHYIVMWLYFGDTDVLVHAVENGHIRIQGLYANAEWLGIAELAHFVREWHKEQRQRDSAMDADNEDSD